MVFENFRQEQKGVTSGPLKPPKNSIRTPKIKLSETEVSRFLYSHLFITNGQFIWLPDSKEIEVYDLEKYHFQWNNLSRKYLTTSF